MKTAVIGFPRIGERRELKKATEKYFKSIISQNELLDISNEIKVKHWKEQEKKEIDFISSNDFSFYDNFLDTAIMLNAIPKRYKELNLNQLDTYFAMAKGYQDNKADIKALPMKKWFNTNYHYIVSEIDNNTKFKLNSKKIIMEYIEAKKNGIITKPTLIGPLTFLKLINTKDKDYSIYINDVVDVYIELLKELSHLNVELVQIDEPILVSDLDKKDIDNFNKIYNLIFDEKIKIKLLLQTYFGDVRDIYEELIKQNFYAIGLDFNEGNKNLELIKKHGFSNDKKIFVGIINGKNIWKNNYKKSFLILEELLSIIDKENIILNTSCSLLHVPYTLKNEIKLNDKYKKYLSFSCEKLEELLEIKTIINSKDYKNNIFYKNNIELIKSKDNLEGTVNKELRNDINNLLDSDFNRDEKFEIRILKQNDKFKFPIIPTTTIGSFPQTDEIRKKRREFKNAKISLINYDNYLKEKIIEIVKLQEEIDLDVLVHGEFERNDMVEYFGENLDGFIFTENAWVQSYGTRGVKPPIIFGDIKRTNPITIKWIKFAQSITNRPMKGMLTGPITMQNWSFVREDLSLKEIAYQIALAIQEEVLDLEKNGINIIQIDEAALREKLPIRKNEWKEYLDWAIKSFRLTNSKVQSETQIHTHMCYSEFKDIIDEIKAMDADVITIEASKSDLSMLDVLKEKNYDKEIGPGVYDIHSSRVPSEKEFEEVINRMINTLGIKGLWVNPDCGLKTRGEEETIKSLDNMVKAVKKIRKSI